MITSSQMGDETADARSPAFATVIEARHAWRGLALTEIWQYRELLYFLIWRDLKVRYRQTFFGVAWAVLQPVSLMAVFAVSMGRIPGVGPSDVPYPLFVLAGLVPWTLFAQAVTGGSNSLVEDEAVITKVYFPRLLLPVASVGSLVLDLVIALGVLALVMAWFGALPSLAILWIPAVTVFLLIAAVAIGSFLAALNVRYRDVRYAVPFLVQLWLFASPVVYQSSLIPEGWQTVYALNPMAGVIEAFRWALLGGPRADDLIALSAVSSIVILVGSLLYFRRVERSFADVI